MTWRAHPFHDHQEAELARWPGVAWSREVRAKHYALLLRFGEICRFVVYPGSPGDGARGAKNHLRDVRQALQAIGARRVPTPRGTPTRRQRNPTEPCRLSLGERITGGPFRDPWQVLRARILQSAPERE